MTDFVKETLNGFGGPDLAFGSRFLVAGLICSFYQTPYVGLWLRALVTERI
jgi:hypothetical protein